MPNYQRRGTSLTTLSGAYASLLTPTATKTANYTAAPGDLVPFDTTSGALTLTLPTTPADNTRVGAKIITQGGTNGVTIAAGGTDRIATGAATTRSLKILGEAVELQYQASTGLWFIAASDTPVGQLDLRYVGASATDSGGRVYTLKLDATNPPSTGTRGLVISRSAQGFPVGIRFEDTAGSDVAEIGLDSSTTDFVLYDDVVNGDILRFAQGGYGILGRAVGHPVNSRRLDIVSSAADTTLASLLHFANDNTSSTTDYMRGQNSGTDNFNVSKSGFAGFGAPYTGWSASASVESKGGIVAWRSNANPFFFLQLTGTASQQWAIQIDAANGNRLQFLDNTNNKQAMALYPSDQSVSVGASGLVVGATGGFLNIPTIAGTPTGTPVNLSRAPIAYDTAANKLWIYNGSWRSVTLA